MMNQRQLNNSKIDKLVMLSICLLSASLTANALTIQQAFEEAQKNDPALRSSKFNQNANLENLALAKSRLRPQISVQGSTNQTTQTTSQEVAGSGTLSRSFSGPAINHQIVMKQALLRPREVRAVKYAELQEQYGKKKYQLYLNELWVKVSFAYFDCVGANQILKEYEIVVPEMYAAAHQEKIKYSLGESTIDELIEADALAQNSESLFIQSKQAKHIKCKTLEIFTKKSANEIEQISLATDAKNYFDKKSRDDIWEKFKENSIELRLAKLTEMMQEEKIALSKAEDLPTLDLLIAMNVAKNDATSTQGYQYKNNQIGVQYSIPLISGGGGTYSVRQAGYIYEASIQDTLVLEQKLEIDFDNSWYGLISAISRHSSARSLWVSSATQLKAVKRSYELGVKTSANVANLMMIAAKRKIDLINAELEIIKIHSKLNKSEYLERAY
jgi:outer membrane protein TolC